MEPAVMELAVMELAVMEPAVMEVPTVGLLRHLEDGPPHQPRRPLPLASAKVTRMGKYPLRMEFAVILVLRSVKDVANRASTKVG
jgi:hypothetical protein